jgi:hypothetical protein
MIGFMRKNVLLIIFLLTNSGITSAQITPSVYPKIVGYFSLVHVVATADLNGVTHNFNPAYTVGFPTGINILKSDKIGFSFEITPFIKTENGTSRMSNILFHPGVMFRFPYRFTINQRLAFETNGRFGETTVFSKVVKVNPNSTFFVAIPVPVRFGNSQPVSVGIALQVGIGF